MAETLVSPGVLARENDQSFITQQPVQVGAAIVGPTVKGPVEQPTLVTSYSDYQNRFGTTFESGSNVYSYFTSIAAFNYFNNGGNTMLVTRVVSGSAGTQWTFATASVYTGDSYSTHGTLVTTVDGLAPGSFQNVTGSVATYTVGLTGSLGNGGVATITLNTETTIDTITVTNPGNGWSIGEIITIPSASLGYGIGIAGTDTTFTLQAGNIDFYQSAVTFDAIDKGAVWNNSGSMLAGGALTSGSIDNVRLQVTTSNTASGTFSLVVRRGDDNATNPVVLESWTNMSLDPTQPNFVSRVIGDTTFNYNSGENYLEVSGSYPNASRYIKVKTVNLLTPNYLDNAGNAKSQYTGSIPGVGSGSIGGAFCAGTGNNISSYVGGGNYYDLAGTGVGAVTQGLVGSDYTNMLNLLSNQDDYAFNVLLTPGLFNSAHASQTTTAINNTQGRGDSIYVLDPITYAASISATTTQAASRNTSYAAMYWPWLQTIDPDSGQNEIGRASCRERV